MEINIYSMTEDELRVYATSKRLNEPMITTLILRVKNNYKWCEIAQETSYSKQGIIYHKKKLEKVLDMKL